jgi:hypothetical protein
MRDFLADLGTSLPALDVNVIELLANIVLLTMIVTFALGVVAYAAYKLRDRKRAAAKAGLKASADGGPPVFFARYVPDPADFPSDPALVDEAARGRASRG